MKLSEIFAALGDGELSNLGIVTDGVIDNDKLPKVMRNINLALADLHTRFILRKNVAEIEAVPEKTQYTIESPDFIEILNVSMAGAENSLLKPNTLYLKVDSPTAVIVQYKATHPPLTESDILNDSEVELPIAYLNALLYFIGSRMLMSVPNQMDGDLNEGTRYTQKYMEQITLLTNQGIDVDTLSEPNKFNNRGFV